MTEDGMDRWTPPWVDTLAGPSGPESTVCDPPEGMPAAQPLRGFTYRGRHVERSADTCL